MQLVERQLKLIEKLIIANERQIDDIYNYFFAKDKSSISLSEKAQIKKLFTGKDLAISEYVGLWKSKKISDSQEYAKNLRNQSQYRNL